jgi:hypothetical protein
MNIPKKYFHDRLILLLLSIMVFLAFLATVWVLLKLDSGQSTSYIVQYRGNAPISPLKQGSVSELIAFIAFDIMLLVASNALLVLR